MHVVEIVYPGVELDLADDELRFELEDMLRHVEGCVIEAAIALSLYQESQANQGPQKTVRERHLEWERESDLRSEVDAQISKEAGEAFFSDPYGGSLKTTVASCV